MPWAVWLAAKATRGERAHHVSVCTCGGGEVAAMREGAAVRWVGGFGRMVQMVSSVGEGWWQFVDVSLINYRVSIIK